MKSRNAMGLACLLFPLHVFAAGNQAAVCQRGHFHFYFGPLAAAKGDHTIISIWMDGGENDKKFGLGHVMERSPNGDLMLLVADPNKDKAGPGPVIIYTAGLRKAVMVTNPDGDGETSVAIADCTIKDVPKSKH